MMNKNSGNSIANKKGVVTSTIVLALMAALLPACTPERPTASNPTATGNVTAEEVADNTAQLIGRTVTVRSQPVNKVGPNAFTISDREFFGGENILVLNASGVPLALPETNTEVQVTGTVARFVTADIERAYGWDLDPNLYVEYEGKPAIIAQSIALAPEPGEITKNPSQYYGRALAVPGEVENIVGSNAFTLDEDRLIGASDLLVLVPNSQRAIQAGQNVVATGVLRPFVVAEIERDYDLTWDLNLQKQLEAEYRNKPVLIARFVYPSAVPATAQ